MSWTNFMIYLMITYALYYGVNLMLDFWSGGRSPSTIVPDSPQYQIVESAEPIDASLIIPDQQHSSQDAYLSSGTLGFSGAQKMTGLMAEAANEMIEFTKKVAF